MNLPPHLKAVKYIEDNGLQDLDRAFNTAFDGRLNIVLASVAQDARDTETDKQIFKAIERTIIETRKALVAEGLSDVENLFRVADITSPLTSVYEALLRYRYGAETRRRYTALLG